jgi:hypothetical protein
MQTGAETFQIRTAGYDGVRPGALLVTAVSAARYWFPSTNPAGDRLLFGTVEPVDSSFRFRIFSLDLTDPQARPQRLGDSDDATQPLTNGSSVAWRAVDTNVSEWSKSLVVADAAGNHPRSKPVASALTLSMGRRYLTYDTLNSPDLMLYDMQEDRFVVIESHPAPSTIGFQRLWTLVAGNLLVFRRVDFNPDSKAGPAVCWAILPPPSS